MQKPLRINSFIAKYGPPAWKTSAIVVHDCDSLGATHDPPPVDPGEVTCFCEFCQAKAKQRGISFERAKEGFLSRKYSEMRLANLNGAGDAVRELTLST